MRQGVESCKHLRGLASQLAAQNAATGIVASGKTETCPFRMSKAKSRPILSTLQGHELCAQKYDDVRMAAVFGQAALPCTCVAPRVRKWSGPKLTVTWARSWAAVVLAQARATCGNVTPEPEPTQIAILMMMQTPHNKYSQGANYSQAGGRLVHH